MSYLGKRFQQTIKGQLDIRFIEDRYRGIEFLKLHILDCAEEHLRPPTFKDVAWARNLCHSRDYGFIWDEFANWLRTNQLEWRFELKDDEVFLLIDVKRTEDFSKVKEPELSLNSWLEKVRSK